MTQFEKVSSPYDITEIDLLQTLLRNQFLTMARFRQHVHGNQQRLTEIPEDVIGITKIRILPVPALEQSLYLAITDEGLAVPVAYAIYSKLGST